MRGSFPVPPERYAAPSQVGAPCINCERNPPPIVDVYIRHLRSKIDTGTERQLIRTVRGVGYMISQKQ